jgi:hypothetical protein
MTSRRDAATLSVGDHEGESARWRSPRVRPNVSQGDEVLGRLLSARDIAEGRELGDVTTLRDPAIMEELKLKIAERGDQE